MLRFGRALVALAVLTQGIACSSSEPSDEPAPPDLTPLGNDRPVDPIVPADFDANVETPLVILLHGFGASGLANDLVLRMADQVDNRNFILLRPDGTIDAQGSRFWNATDACCNFHGSDVDDVAYIAGLIDEARSRYAISTVGIIGHSNGGFMSHRFACDRAEMVDAIASLAGPTWQDASRCAPSDTVAALQMHGTEDSTVPFDGGTGESGLGGIPGAAETVAQWAALNGCDATPETAEPADFSDDGEGAETVITHHPACDDGGGASLWEIVGVGHVPDLNDAWRAGVIDHLLRE